MKIIVGVLFVLGLILCMSVTSTNIEQILLGLVGLACMRIALALGLKL